MFLIFLVDSSRQLKRQGYGAFRPFEDALALVSCEEVTEMLGGNGKKLCQFGMTKWEPCGYRFFSAGGRAGDFGQKMKEASAGIIGSELYCVHGGLMSLFGQGRGHACPKPGFSRKKIAKCIRRNAGREGANRCDSGQRRGITRKRLCGTEEISGRADPDDDLPAIESKVLEFDYAFMNEMDCANRTILLQEFGAGRIGNRRRKFGKGCGSFRFFGACT